MAPDVTDPRRLVADVITGEAVDSDRIPALLGLLDVGDRQVRLGAATALCVLADHDPDTVPVLARRLAERATDLEATLALSYLIARFPTVVDPELDALADDGATGPRLGGSLLDRSQLGDREVGRTSRPGERSEYGPRQVYTDDDDEETSGGHDDGAATDPGGQRQFLPEADWLPIIEHESPFDRLTVLAPRDRRRYGDAYRTLGVDDGGEFGLAVRLLDRRPDGAFRDDVGSRLAEWASVSDLDHVLTLHGWGTEPRLWAATDYAAESLADQGRLPPTEAVWHGTRLADTVADLHERGVVHGGLDPGNVAYYGNVLTEDARQPPLLDNVGLIRSYRYYFAPATYLDPRYAAPEYYDRRYGRVDHATDVYALGALCFRLFTGEAPYAGSFASVKERILDGTLPVPSEVTDVPPGVDDVVRKAMARQKLARYETASQLAQELRALGEIAGGGE